MPAESDPPGRSPVPCCRISPAAHGRCRERAMPAGRPCTNAGCLLSVSFSEVHATMPTINYRTIRRPFRSTERKDHPVHRNRKMVWCTGVGREGKGTQRGMGANTGGGIPLGRHGKQRCRKAWGRETGFVQPPPPAACGAYMKCPGMILITALLCMLAGCSLFSNTVPYLFCKKNTRTQEGVSNNLFLSHVYHRFISLVN